MTATNLQGDITRAAELVQRSTHTTGTQKEAVPRVFCSGIVVQMTQMHLSHYTDLQGHSDSLTLIQQKLHLQHTIKCIWKLT